MPAAYKRAAEDIGFLTIEGGTFVALDGQHRLLALRQVVQGLEGGEGEFQNDYSLYHMASTTATVTPPPAMLYSRRVPQTIYRVPEVSSTGTITIASGTTNSTVSSTVVK